MRYTISKDPLGVGYYVYEGSFAVKYTFTLWGAKRAIRRALKIKTPRWTRMKWKEFNIVFWIAFALGFLVSGFFWYAVFRGGP